MTHTLHCFIASNYCLTFIEKQHTYFENDQQSMQWYVF